MRTVDFGWIFASFANMQVAGTHGECRIDHFVTSSSEFVKDSVVTPWNTYTEIGIHRSDLPAKDPRVLAVVPIKQPERLIRLHVPSRQSGTLVRFESLREGRKRSIKVNVTVGDD